MTGTPVDHGYLGLKTAPPRKRSPSQPRVRTKVSKAKPRLLEHVHYGQGKLVGVRHLDSGDYVATVKFGDGAERAIQLRQQYWVSDIASVIPEPPKPVAQKKARPRRRPVDDEDEESYLSDEDSVDSGGDAESEAA